MRLSWSTDVHLNFLSVAEVDAFGTTIMEQKPDAVLLTGDISEAPAIRRHLEQLQKRVACPLYFVLGNHDFYRGSIESVRKTARELTATEAGPFWLPSRGVVSFGEESALVGVDGWGDGRAGDYANTPINLNDFLLIEDLAGLGREELVARVRAIGDAEAATLRPLLEQACESRREVIVATHVPPFREACWHDGQVSNDEWLPWFTCIAVGEVLLAAARAHPECRLTVLCGHTHSAGQVSLADNLSVHTGGADYGSPSVARLLELG
jgi:3',5'-cyclic AMP phosphodiesterase CpdA